MAATVWKGHLTFGLVSIPVKLQRAARAERVSFRQLNQATGKRVRQTYIDDQRAEEDREEAPQTSQVVAAAGSSRLAPIPIRESARQPQPEPAPAPPPPGPAPAREIARSEIAKGYEYEKDRFVMLSREELAKITPQTAREMQILEFVKLEEVDPIQFETSYYMLPDRGGERAYGLLFAALRQSGFVGVAQLAMHNREHVVLIRPGKTGLILHTMFYEDEVRRSEEYRTDATVSPKELELAMMLVNNLAAPFEPAKYHDTYREKVEEIIRAKIAGEEVVESPAARTAPVVNILEALQQSLQQSARDRKPATRQEESAPPRRKRK